MEKSTIDTKENLIKDAASLEEKRNLILESIKDKEILLKGINEQLSPKKRSLKDFLNYCFYGTSPSFTKEQINLLEKIGSESGLLLGSLLKESYVEIEKKITGIRSNLRGIEKEIIFKTLCYNNINPQGIKTDNYNYKFNYNNLLVSFVNESDRLQGEVHNPPTNENERNYLKNLQLVSSSKSDLNTIPDDIFSQFYEQIIKTEFIPTIFKKQFSEENLKKNSEGIFQDYFKYRRFIIYGSPSNNTTELIKIVSLTLPQIKEVQDENMCIIFGPGETLETVVSGLYSM